MIVVFAIAQRLIHLSTHESVKLNYRRTISDILIFVSLMYREKDMRPRYGRAGRHGSPEVSDGERDDGEQCHYILAIPCVLNPMLSFSFNVAPNL